MFKITYLIIALVTSLVKSESSIEICSYEEEEMDGVKYANILDFAFMAKIVLWNEEEEGGFTYCSGVIINETHVLTAGHCLMHPRCARDKDTKQFNCVMTEASKYDVVMGSSYVFSTEPSIIRRGKDIKIHNKFLETNDYSFDVGVIELDKPVEVPLNYTENSPLNRKIIPDKYSNRSNYKNFFSDKFPVSLLTFGSSTCSSVYTNKARSEMYKIGLDKFQRLKLINMIKPNETMCEELMKAYIEAGIKLKGNNVVCFKTDFKNPDCEDLSGSALVRYPNTDNNLILGITLPPLSCNMNQHLLILRVSSVAGFILGKTIPII